MATVDPLRAKDELSGAIVGGAAASGAWVDGAPVCGPAGVIVPGVWYPGTGQAGCGWQFVQYDGPWPEAGVAASNVIPAPADRRLSHRRQLFRESMAPP
jgi:hypothetical protein